MPTETEIAAAARHYHPDAWRLAATIANYPHIGPTAAKRLLAQYRKHKGLRQLRGGPALQALIVKRGRAIQKVRHERAARRLGTVDVRPLWQRWSTLSLDGRMMERLHGRIVWRAVEEMCHEAARSA